MGDHLVLSVDNLITPESSEGVSSSLKTEPCTFIDIADVDENVKANEEEPLINVVECRICQEEDVIKSLEAPCACSGSLKFAHRKCVQKWCNEKGDIICEICRQPYQPNYIAPPPVPQSEDTSDGSGGLHDGRLLAIAAAGRRLADSEYDENNTSAGAFCRSAALILLILLLLRHAINFGYSDDDGDDISVFISILLLRIGSFILPCYILVWAISIIQYRRERREQAAAVAANEVAFLIQAGPRRGVHFTITPGPAATFNPSPV